MNSADQQAKIKLFHKKEVIFRMTSFLVPRTRASSNWLVKSLQFIHDYQLFM